MRSARVRVCEATHREQWSEVTVESAHLHHDPSFYDTQRACDRA